MTGKQVGCGQRHFARPGEDQELNQAGGAAVAVAERVNPRQVEVGHHRPHQHQREVDRCVLVLEVRAFQPLAEPLEEKLAVVRRCTPVRPDDNGMLAELAGHCTVIELVVEAVQNLAVVVADQVDGEPRVLPSLHLSIDRPQSIQKVAYLHLLVVPGGRCGVRPIQQASHLSIDRPLDCRSGLGPPDQRHTVELFSQSWLERCSSEVLALGPRLPHQ